MVRLVAVMLCMAFAGCSAEPTTNDSPGEDEARVLPDDQDGLPVDVAQAPLAVVTIGPDTTLHFQLGDDVVYRLLLSADEDFAVSGSAWSGDYGMILLDPGEVPELDACDSLDDWPFWDSGINAPQSRAWSAGDYEMWIWGTDEATIIFNEGQQQEVTDEPALVAGTWAVQRFADEKPTSTPPSDSLEVEVNVTAPAIVQVQLTPPFAVGTSPEVRVGTRQGDDLCSESVTSSPAGFGTALTAFSTVAGGFTAFGSFSMDQGVNSPQTTMTVLAGVALVSPSPAVAGNATSTALP